MEDKMDINEYLEKHKDFDHFKGIDRAFKKLTPKITCKDGFSMSVQASQTHYCRPREDNVEYYECVEVGYPSECEELLIPFIEVDTDNPTDTVYPYTDVRVVEAVISKHGGIV
jgi:hypothetical protein